MCRASNENLIVLKWQNIHVISNIKNTAIYIYIYIYIDQHWRIFRSYYRKLAWVGCEPTTTVFRSDALADWAIRPWVQLAVRTKLVQVLQFHLFVQCSRLISVFAFVSCHICFKRSLERIEIRITVVTIWVIIL